MNSSNGNHKENTETSRRCSNHKNRLQEISCEISMVLDQLEEVNRKIAEIEEEAVEKQRNDDHTK